MEYQVNGIAVGHGDDVLQLFDAVASVHVGRHQQTEALVRGRPDTDHQLVIDECAAALDLELPEPVRQSARQVLVAIGVDPDGPIRRLDAGQPTIERLKRIDRLQAVSDQAKDRAVDVASTTIDVASRGLAKARSWLRKRQDDSGGESE